MRVKYIRPICVNPGNKITGENILKAVFFFFWIVKNEDRKCAT